MTMAERKYYTSNNWQTERNQADAAPRIQLADGRWIDATEILQGDQLAKGELERGFDTRMFGGGSPDPMVGAADFMQQQGMTPQQYQAATGGLPFAFNADGTSTLDLGSRKNTYSYEKPDDGFLFKAGPAIMGAMLTAGLMPPGGISEMFSGIGDWASSMNPFGAAGEAASATGGTLASGGGLPSNYWSMMADAGGSTMFDAGVPGLEGLMSGGADLTGVSTFADSAAPWLSEAGSASFGNGLGGLTSMPLSGAYGGVGGGLTSDMVAQVLQTAGTSGGIPSAFGQFLSGAGQLGPGLLNLASSAGPLMQGGDEGASAGVMDTIQKILAGTPGQALGGLLGTDINPAWLGLLGSGLAAGLGVAGTNQKQDAFESLANKYLDLGKPSRDRLEASYANPNSFLAGPDVQAIMQQGSDAAARSLSAKVGNPALSPGAWQQIQKYNTDAQWGMLDNYRRQNAASGGLGVAPASEFDMGGGKLAGTGFDIGGAFLGDISGSKESMLDLMRKLTGSGVGTTFRVT